LWSTFPWDMYISSLLIPLVLLDTSFDSMGALFCFLLIQASSFVTLEHLLELSTNVWLLAITWYRKILQKRRNICF
jgi:hypothetical protein